MRMIWYQHYCDWRSDNVVHTWVDTFSFERQKAKMNRWNVYRFQSAWIYIKDVSFWFRLSFHLPYRRMLLYHPYNFLFRRDSSFLPLSPLHFLPDSACGYVMLEMQVVIRMGCFREEICHWTHEYRKTSGICMHCSMKPGGILQEKIHETGAQSL